MTTPVKEVIKHAAVISEDGMVFLGKSHADCFHQAKNVGIKMSQRAADQGFFTSQGNYLQRTEAAGLAFDRGQIDSPVNILFSKLLWSPTDGGKFEYDSIKGYLSKGEL